MATTQREVWPVKDSKAAIGVCPAKAYMMEKSGELRLVRIGGRTLIPRSEVERLTRVPVNASRSAA